MQSEKTFLMSTPKCPGAQIYPWGVNLTPLPSASNFHDNFTDLIGLSFLFIETKELCKARAKLEMSSHFQIYPRGVKLMDPPSPHSKLPVH